MSAGQRAAGGSIMTEPRRTVTIFLGSSAELAAEQLELGDFFAQINDLATARGLCFRLVRWQWDGNNSPLKNYEQLVRESDLALFLYFTTSGDAMEERFDAAVEAFRTSGSPEVITWFKRLPEGGSVSRELERFRDRLDTQLHHFYNTFETIDTVKLGILMQIARGVEGDDGADGEKNAHSGAVAVEGDRACLWGTPLVDLSDVPVYQGWSSIQDAQRELAEGEAAYQRLRAAVIERPEDAAAAAELGRAAARRTELERALQQGRKQFIDFMRNMARATAGELTERQRQAYRLAEQGRVDAAIAMLDEGEIARDRAAAENDLALADAVREEALERLRTTISEQLQLADLLGSQDPTPELRERIGAILADAAACELKHQLGYRAQLKLGSHLHLRDRDSEAIPHLERASDWLVARASKLTEQEMRDAYWALFYLGGCWNDQREWGRALEVYDKLLTFVDQWRPTWRLWRADILSEKGRTLVNAHRFDEAAHALSDALAGFEGLQDASGRRQAYCYYRLGNMYQGSGDGRRALDAYGKGIELMRSLPTGQGEANQHLLAALLEDRASCLCDLNCNEEALRDLQEAIPIERELAKADPVLYRSSLASALVGCGDAESNLRRYEDAEQHYREALALRRELYAQDARQHVESLAVVLADFGRLYWLMGRSAEGEQLLRESVGLRRPLYEREPLVYGKNLAITLANLGHACQELGRHDEEEACDREALAIMRRLAALQLGKHDDSLASQLLSLASALEDSHPEEAEALYTENRSLLEASVAKGKGELLSKLADCRHNTGCFYGSRGEHERAIEEFEAARSMYRDLYERNGGMTYLEDYSRCLSNLSGELSATGELDRAIATAREGVELTRKLYRREPGHFRKLLAGRVSELAKRLRKAGHKAEAALAYGEAAELLSGVRDCEENAANALWWQAICLWDDDVEASIDAYRRAANAFHALAKFNSETACWRAVAMGQRTHERWREAASAYQATLDAARKAGAELGKQAELWWWLAVCQQHLKDRPRQCEAYREAIRLYHAAGDEDNAAKVERLLKKAEGQGA